MHVYRLWQYSKILDHIVSGNKCASLFELCINGKEKGFVTLTSVVNIPKLVFVTGTHEKQATCLSQETLLQLNKIFLSKATRRLRGLDAKRLGG
jgi:hypothetical protein